MKTESDKDRLYDFDIPIENNRKDEDKPKWGGKTNQTTLDFVNNRYVVLKDFIPKEIINMTMDTWRCIENDEEQYNAIFRPEDELTHSTPEEQRNKSHGAYNFPPAVGIHRYLKNKLDSKTVNECLRKSKCNVFVATVAVFATIRSRKHPFRNYSNLIKYCLYMVIKNCLLFLFLFRLRLMEQICFITLNRIYLVYHLCHFHSIILELQVKVKFGIV